MELSDKKSLRIQVLRGLAIVAVVIIHSIPTGMPQVWVRPFVNFGVALFLFLSGMLSRADKWNPGKRLVKVLIPYAIWTLVYVVLHNYKNVSGIPLTYLKNLITTKSAVMMYYIFVYCELTLLIPVIDKLSRSKFKWVGFLISPVEIIIMRLIPLLMGIKFNKYVDIVMQISFLGWFIYFYIGYLLGNGRLEIKIPTKGIVAMLVVSYPIQMLEGLMYYNLGQQNCGTQLKLSALITSVLTALVAYRYINADGAPVSKFLKLLGDKSFGIYFSHLAIMFVLGRVPHYNDYVIFPINVVVTVLISLLCVIIGGKVLGKFAKYLAL